MIEHADTQYLVFNEISDPAMKTRTWQVLSRHRADVLGIIKFYSPWRQFVFAPSPGCLFNSGCMEDLIAACKASTQDWKDGLPQRQRDDGWT